MSLNRDSSHAADKDAASADRVKCSKYFRELKFSAEWICTRDRFLRDRCYQGLLYPGAHSNTLEYLDWAQIWANRVFSFSSQPIL